MTPQAVKSGKSSSTYTNLKIESRFQEGEILAILGDQFLQKSDVGYIHLREHIISLSYDEVIGLIYA